MFTADDVKAIRSRTSGGSVSSPASSRAFTAADVKKIRSSFDIEQMQKTPKVQQITAPQIKPQQTFTAPKVNTPANNEATPQQKAVHERLERLAARTQPKTTVQELRSGRDFAVIPQVQPNAERDAYVAEYMKKYPNDPFGKIGAELAYKADSNKVLKFTQNLLEAAPILKNITDPINYLDNQAKAKAAAENDALAKMAELEERAKTDPSVLASKEYFDAASKVSRINYANQALQQAIPDDKNSFKSVGEILNKQSQQATNELLEGKTGLGKFATEAAIAGTNLLGSVVAAGAVGVKPLDLISVTSGAQAGQRALDNGESYDKAGLAAASSAAVTRGIESASGFFGSWGSKAADSLAKTEIGKKVLSKVPQNVADWIAKAADTYIGKVAAGGLSEAAEGFTEYYAQGFINNLILDKDTPLSFKEAIRNAALEGTVGLAGMSISNINAPVTRVQDSVQTENPAQEVQGETVVNKNEAKATSAELINKLRNSIPQISNNQPVAHITGNEFQKGEKNLVEQVGDFFRSLGNKVFRTGLGEVRLDERGVKDSMGHGIGRRKATAFAAVPQIIANGTEIDYQQNWKERGYDTRVFAAPIKVGENETNYVAAVITQGTDNRYYLHEVLDQDGNIIYSRKKEAGNVQTDLLSKDSIGNPASIDSIIPQQQNESNNNIFQNGQGNAQLSEPMPQTEAIQPPEGQEMDTDLDESIESLMYDIDAQEMARRARAAAKAPNEKTHELLTNTDNGIIASDKIDDSMQLLGKVTFAANKTISQVLDQAVKGAKGDLPLSEMQMQQLRNNLYNAIEKPLNEAKAKYVSGIKSKAGSFAKDMARLGIKAGSKESAAVQWIGEGQRQGPDGKIVEYTLADLQQQFPNSWQNIVEAAQICRNIYDAYVNEINDALKLVYPDIEARAAATMDKINARVAYNTNQAQLWLAKAAQLEQRAAGAAAETHSAESVAAAKTADRTNRLNDQAARARETAERYTRAAEAARAKADDLQRRIDSGEILRNKRLMPRKDYFHHFNEMEQGLGGFVNIISGAHDISAQLAGKSEFTKPKSKWWGALQQRAGGRYTADAVGGMARYIPAAEYKIAFDPFIAQMRGNVEALVNVTENTKNANSLIEYLTDWTNDLAGKTNFLDRPVQKLFDRKAMKALEFLNNRAKANAVAGNLGSAIVQIGNIPNAMMFISSPADWASAAQDIATGNSKESQSIFLNERYIGNTLDKLQKSNPVKDFSNWILEIGDRQAARLIWNAAYNQFESGRAKGLRKYENAVDYADDITRRAIAGRGVGEMALTQKSRIIKLFAPFQVEVNNTYNLLVEKMGEKDAAALMRYAVGAFAINSLLYVITGRRALFDPIDALIDAIKGMKDEDEEDERTAGERVAGAISRVGGEVISNMPYASTAATFLTGTENSEKIFGEADPTRYGTGNIAVQTLTEPIAQFINGEKIDLLGPATAILPAYGGKQIERFTRGAQSLGYLPRVDIRSSGVDVDRNEFGASRSASGRIRFPITDPADQFKTMLFGEWSTSRGKDYIDKGLQPLSDKQSEAMEKAFAAGISPDTYYDALLAARQAVSQKDANGKTIPLSQDKDKVRLVKKAVPGLTSKEYKLLFEALGISKNAY